MNTMANTVKSCMDEQTYIHLSLLYLGIKSWNNSSRRLEAALQYAIDNQISEKQTMKCLYADLAKAQSCKWNAMERSLRYAIRTLWDKQSECCTKLLYRSCELMPKPCISEFLYLYAAAYNDGVIQDWVDARMTQAV